MVKTKRKKIHEALYHIMVLATIIFISGTLFLLSPLFVLSSFFYTTITLIVIGIATGAFLKKMLEDLDEITHKHHAGFFLIILLSATINFFSITVSKTLFTDYNFLISFQSAIIFTISFLIPYIYHYYKKHK